MHLTRIEPGAGFVRGLRAVHAGPVTAEEIVEVDGVRLTSLERTAVDVAMAGDFAQALVVFDRALAADAAVSTMAHLIGSRRRWRGTGIARRALSFADGASESVGESWSRAQMIEAGFPMPRLQHTFQTDAGSARTDFDWDGILVGEFDGLQKYGRLLRPGESPRDALIREKRREDALRAQGIMVIRWTWGTLERGELPSNVAADRQAHARRWYLVCGRGSSPGSPGSAESRWRSSRLTPKALSEPRLPVGR